MKTPWRRKKLAGARKKVSGTLAKASEVYADRSLIRAAVNAVPFIGGPLDALISTRAQKISQQRLMQFLDALKTEISKLEERFVDRQYLETDEWFDLVMRAMEAAVRTRDGEKIQLYAKVLTGAISRPDRQQFSPEEYLAVLVELTPKEIHVARAIFSQQSDRPEQNESDLQWASRKGWEKLHEQVSVPVEDLPFVLLRLQRSGLIKEITGAYYDYAGGVYLVTDSFRKLMSFVGESSGSN